MTMSFPTPPESLPAPSPVSVYGSIQFDMPSAISGRTYRIFIFKPATPPPPSGYPVVVVTDGNMSFPLAATMDAAFSLNGGKAAIVVGIGYPTDDPIELVRLRTHDLTPPTLVKLGDSGGSENFYRFLIEELRPAIAGAYPVNNDDQTLFGYSWGGMFALSVLFNHPGSFRTFIAASPSIWWNDRALLNDEPRFAREIQAGSAAPRVLILVGSKEQDVPTELLPGMNRAQMERLMSESRMVDNARELAARLQQIRGEPGYFVSYHAFEGEDHLTSLSASIGRALAFTLRP